MTPEQLIESARAYIGTPFHIHARLKGVGIDCVGLLICLAREAGVAIPDFRDYGRAPEDNRMLQTFAKLGMDRLVVPEPGAVCAIWVANPDVAVHAAVYTGTSLIHTSETRQAVVEHGYTLRWLKHTHSFWALPGVEYKRYKSE